MKYELEPDNRNQPDDVLFADLRAVAEKLGKSSITKEDYASHGRFSPATMQKRFGSWNKALALSGLTIKKRVNIETTEFLDDLKSVARKLGLKTVTTEDYRTHGRFAQTTITRSFGTWSAALAAANLESTGWKPPATDDELFDNMANVWEHVGRQPKQKDFHPPISRYSDGTYVKRFGSWREALEAFVRSANAEQPDRIEIPTPTGHANPTRALQNANRTSRNPSWRTRFLVMKRDKFTCRLCGASPAKNPSVVLHIDHVHPWSKGGETIISNLQTCCEVCNLGKSDLPMTDEQP